MNIFPNLENKKKVNQSYNIYPYCEQIWDNKTGKIKYSNNLEIADCCLKNCKDNYKYCNNQCQKIYKNNKRNIIHCQNSCITLNKNLCGNFCQLAAINLQLNNTFYKCTEKSKCNTKYTYPNKNCINKNKKNIINCVNENCNKKNSKEYCKKYIDFFIKLPFNQSKLLNETKQKHISINLILIIILIFIIIFSIMIFSYYRYFFN